LGGRDGQHGKIRKAVAEHLHRLHLRTGLVVHLAALDGTGKAY
jgi:DNA-binding IclR family transcriptional regulator